MFSYPYGYPDNPYLPWVWDAVFDPVNREIEVYTMSPQSCNFNKTYTSELIDMFPMFRHSLADGLKDNINVHHEAGNIYFQRFKDMLDESDLKGKLFCEFYSLDVNGNRIQSYSVQAKVILNTPMSIISTTNIICPLGSFYSSYNKIMEIDNTIRLEFRRTIKPTDNRAKSVHEKTKINYKKYVSVPIQVHSAKNHKWPLKRNSKNIDKLILEPLELSTLSYQYDLSVCTANDRLNRETLVEWIEYHLLVGVNHFYIYDTSIKTVKRNSGSSRDRMNNNAQKEYTKTLKEILSDYISQNIVTVIDWHYDNCAKKFASGRQFLHMHPSYDLGRSGQPNGFQPPRPVAQYAGLASCYGRFRRDSKYIAHIDEDEFLTVPMNIKQQKLDNQQWKTDNSKSIHSYYKNHDIIDKNMSEDSTQSSQRKYKNVVEYIDSVLNKPENYKKYPALSFHPMKFRYCY